MIIVRVKTTVCLGKKATRSSLLLLRESSDYYHFQHVDLVKSYIKIQFNHCTLTTLPCDEAVVTAVHKIQTEQHGPVGAQILLAGGHVKICL